ncbi:MAG: HAD family hydrolase [Cyanobacteria bacterium P01_F01_bin.86]
MFRIFTDFDGPIMDVSERYYQVYQYCLAETHEPAQTITVLSKEAFWELKRAQVPERQIGRISGLHDDQARQFARLRRETVHSSVFLKHDHLIPGATDALAKMQALNYHLVVVTMRRANTLNTALIDHQLEAFFPPEVRYCIPDNYTKTSDEIEKTRLVEKALTELPAACEAWMIGDTEADITAAQAHNVPIVAVLSGIRDRERLETYKPDFIVDNLQAAIATILAQIPSHVTVTSHQPL